MEREGVPPDDIAERKRLVPRLQERLAYAARDLDAAPVVHRKGAQALADSGHAASRASTDTAPDHSPVAPIRIRPAEDIEDLTSAAFASHRKTVMALLPNADVEQVGATAVPGALTKGDVDVLVRVSEADFSAAIEILRSRYTVHQPHNWTSTLASFKDPTASDPEVGVQLVVSGSSDDCLFGPFRDALIRDANLLAEYNGLKKRLDGADYDRYTERKAKFIERVLCAIQRPGR